MKKSCPHRLTATIAGAMALLSAPVLADQLSDMAARLAKLRGEVETLSSELASESSDGRDQLRSLSRQKSDLEFEVKKEQTRAAKLRRAINDKRKSVEEAKNQDGAMAPLFEKALDQVRQYVRTTLPFRTGDRVAALEKLESQYKSGLLSAPKALGRLWSFMEDEFRLTRENGLYQQTVVIDGQSRLADVVRLGMVMLYFKVGESTVGKAVKEDGEWGYETLLEKDEEQAVLKLFQSFKTQIRAGYFQIPNALPPLVQGAEQ